MLWEGPTRRRDGSEWTLTLDIIPAARTNTATQKAAMIATFRECCDAGATSTTACSMWRRSGGESADFCHMRGEAFVFFSPSLAPRLGALVKSSYRYRT